jgi:hypothetical protein
MPKNQAVVYMFTSFVGLAQNFGIVAKCIFKIPPKWNAMMEIW